MKFTPVADGTLLDLLQAYFPNASKTTLRQMLQHSRVTLDGEVVNRANTLVRAGQVIDVGPVRKAAPQPPGAVLLRDTHVIAIEKPAGILSVSLDAGVGDTIYRQLNAYVQETSRRRERIFLVHRLDRGTSGILLFALSREIQLQLRDTWSTTEKRYWALVEGRPPREADTIRSWLRENRNQRVYSAPEGPGAKLAITHYRVKEFRETCTLLDVQIDTGRKNQIRVHLSELGCPIVGDPKYGARTDPIGRLGLHAYFLAFTHPVSGERIRLRSPMPDAFRQG